MSSEDEFAPKANSECELSSSEDEEPVKVNAEDVEKLSKRLDKVYEEFKALNKNYVLEDPQCQKQMADIMEELKDLLTHIQRLGLFRDDERVNDIPPTKLNLMLVTYLLGMTCQMTFSPDPVARNELCREAKEFFIDFIKKLVDYWIIPQAPSIWLQCRLRQQRSIPSRRQRSKKIQELKSAKHMDNTISELSKRIESGEDVDDHVYTSLYLERNKRAFLEAKIQLDNVLREEVILKWKIDKLLPARNAFHSPQKDLENYLWPSNGAGVRPWYRGTGCYNPLLYFHPSVSVQENEDKEPEDPQDSPEEVLEEWNESEL